MKANREKVTQGHAGIGSASHLCGLQFLGAVDAPVTSVAYRGTAPALNDLVAGQFDFMCDQTLNVLQPIQSGLIKAYAATTRQRLAVAPDLPTASEAGLPGFETNVWFGLWAPKGTPKPIIDRLADGAAKGAGRFRGEEQACVRRRRDRAAGSRTPEALRAHLKAEIDKWVPLIRKAGITAD